MIAAIGIIGSIASIIGLYALVQSRTNRRIKALLYEATPSFALASAASDSGYRLSILYEQPDQPAETVRAAYVTFLRLANFGREPIRQEDIASANPLRVAVRMVRGKVLDIGLESSRREVCRVAVEPMQSVTKPGRTLVTRRGGRERRIRRTITLTSAAITFDFLDHHDGAAVRILSSEEPESVELLGDIIGMPAGIGRSGHPEEKGLWGRVGFALFCVAETAAVALSFLLFRLVTGAWHDVWLLVVLPAAVVTVGIITVVVAMTIWPSNARKFPDELELPRWAMRFIMQRVPFDD